MILTAGISSQPGRFAGDWITPVTGSSGLPQAIPTASGRSKPNSFKSSSPYALKRSIAPYGPPASFVANVRLPRIRMSPFSSQPRTAIHFVPPIAMPSKTDMVYRMVPSLGLNLSHASSPTA